MIHHYKEGVIISSCTFFGHRDCPLAIKPKVREILIDLVENQSVDMFYVGRNGAFDLLVRSVLRELVREYPQINYAVVLERLPEKNNESQENFSDTILPEGIEKVPPRFAISWRNKWMLRQSDCVVTYITHSWGGAAQYESMAALQKKKIINLAETELTGAGH